MQALERGAVQAFRARARLQVLGSIWQVWVPLTEQGIERLAAQWDKAVAFHRLNSLGECAHSNFKILPNTANLANYYCLNYEDTLQMDKQSFSKWPWPNAGSCLEKWKASRSSGIQRMSALAYVVQLFVGYVTQSFARRVLSLWAKLVLDIQTAKKSLQAQQRQA